jgi:hypothetical protein
MAAGPTRGDGAGRRAIGPSEVVRTSLELFGLRRFVGRVREQADADYLQHVRAVDSSGSAAGDVPLALHMIAHQIAKTERLEVDPVRLSDPLRQGFKQFDYDPRRPMCAQAVSEGFAEWLRRRATGQLTNLSPEQRAASDYAEAWVEGKGLTVKLDRVRDLIRAWVASDPAARSSALVGPAVNLTSVAGLTAGYAIARDAVMRVPLRSKVVLAGVLCLSVLMCYVPWTYTYNASGAQRERPAGYSFVFDPPAPEHDRPAYGVKVDVPRAAIPMAVVVCATIAGVALTGGKTRKQG